MEVTNDPRMFAKNVLWKRMAAFQVISVSCVLMAKLCCTEMLALESDHIDSIAHYLAFLLLAAAFLMNLFSAIIIIMQLFHLTRLSTSGPTGFELSQSYYLNENIVNLRHLAACSFFSLIPVFLTSVALAVWVNLKDMLLHKIPLCAFILLAAFVVAYVSWIQQSTFRDKYDLLRKHQQPLMMHLQQTRAKGSLLSA
eukprot:CAMPEP_0170638554 /NCGR_PEP_ID=MMETSP0224-20130122/39121_1 /TAXON_ID=285029 /ORGANISM="Togula jolla, Strain CCCM 725" /LENGTH=196 /DNA_ID=CAMNT_0010968737 /DNA_START=128 /DNA_END=718 /DNA_ORIENTATION=-